MAWTPLAERPIYTLRPRHYVSYFQARRRIILASVLLLLLLAYPLVKSVKQVHLQLLAKDYRGKCDDIIRYYPYIYPAQPRLPSVPPTSMPWRPNVPEADKARIVTPKQLLESPPSHSRIIHQSWKHSDLSSIRESAGWRHWEPQDAWRAFHSVVPADSLDAEKGKEWIYVFWSDEDNRLLVEQRYPHYLEGYVAWNHGISRADFVRNLYMHAFGGVYADLDFMPLSNLGGHIPAFINGSSGSSTAYVGEMHTGRGARQFSIPNAWLASTRPLHPFWEAVADHSYTLLAAQGHVADNIEVTTGPVPLRDAVLNWQLTCKEREGSDMCRNYELRVLDQGEVYPFSWDTGNKAHKCICLQRDDGLFNAARCNAIFPNAWAITYWSSSWWSG